MAHFKVTSTACIGDVAKDRKFREKKKIASNDEKKICDLSVIKRELVQLNGMSLK